METQPRILMVLTEFPPRVGGMQTHAHNLVKHLCQRGYRIEVLTYQPGDADEHAAIECIDRQLPCPVHRCLSRVGFVHNLKTITEIGQRFKPDLLYTSTVFYGRAADMLGIPAVARSVGNDVMRPWIAYPYGLGSRLASHPALDQRLYRAFRRLDYPELIETLFRNKRRALMVDSAKRYTEILANSGYTKSLLTDIGVDETRLDIVTGGVDHERFSKIDHNRMHRLHWGIPDGRFLLITVCRLVAKKGIDFLIESMEALGCEFPDIHLLIVGDGRKAKRLKRRASRSQAADRITFTGVLPHGSVDSAYGAADAFVLASRVQIDQRTGLKDAETMGRVLCEANAAGIPVIAARSGGIPSVINHQENGLLFEPDDLGDFIKQLKKLRSDQKIRDQLIRAGQKRARDEFDWSVIVRRHEAAFERCLNRGEHTHV